MRVAVGLLAQYFGVRRIASTHAYAGPVRVARRLVAAPALAQPHGSYAEAVRERARHRQLGALGGAHDHAARRVAAVRTRAMPCVQRGALIAQVHRELAALVLAQDPVAHQQSGSLGVGLYS